MEGNIQWYGFDDSNSLVTKKHLIYFELVLGLLSHPGILGVTLCFCTCSCAGATTRAAGAAAAGRRLLFMTLTLNFQGQIWNLLYLSSKWSNYHEMKSKHIDRILGLKCDHWVRPWPWPWLGIFKVKYVICYISAKNGPIATKRKTNISIELKTSNVTIGFDLGHDLDLEFSRSNMEFAISQPKMFWLPRNEKQAYQLNFRPQMWPSGLTLAMALTLNFQGKIWNLLYLSQKWSDCHEKENKYIDWTQDIKCDHWVRPWPWPWPWIFQVKFGICYISAKNVLIATKRKANISIEL